jgi:hypothetical protein
VNANVVWLTILQGFATYVSRNLRLLLDKFVGQSDKQTIQIERHDFVCGSPLNDWASIFPQFAEELEDKAWY